MVTLKLGVGEANERERVVKQSEDEREDERANQRVNESALLTRG